MSLKKPNCSRVTLGMFRTENKAQEYVEHYKKFRMRKDCVSKFFVVKRDRKKAGQKSFEAYCLYPR